MQPHFITASILAGILFLAMASCSRRSTPSLPSPTNPPPELRTPPAAQREPLPAVKPSLLFDPTNVHALGMDYRGGLWRVIVGADGVTNTTVLSFDSERYGGNHRVGKIPFRYRISWGE